jgi:hypothetical protein
VSGDILQSIRTKPPVVRAAPGWTASPRFLVISRNHVVHADRKIGGLGWRWVRRIFERQFTGECMAHTISPFTRIWLGSILVRRGRTSEARQRLMRGVARGRGTILEGKR